MTIAEYNLCVEQFADSIYRFVLKNLRDTEGAKDIVQDTYEKLWQKHEGVNYKKAKSYLFTAAYHTMIDMIRRQKNTENIEEAADVQDNRQHQYSDVNEILHKAIQYLPEIQRSVLLLRDYEGYNYKEIEAITGLSESQVKVYIYRARKFLMEYIGSPEKVL
jgi:RNA polymerase sigma-70 factor (ECF subfamily)